MECSSCPIQPIVNAFVEADLDRNMGRCQSKSIKVACTKLQEAMRNVCLTCVDEVNDNNPSNHGQTFFSLDSGHCQTVSSKGSSEVSSRADWISSHAHLNSGYFQDGAYRPYNGESSVDSAIIAMRNAKRKDLSVNTGKLPSTREHAADSIDDKFFTDDVSNGSNASFQDEYSVTKLPSAVEAIILKELINFSALPPLHQMMVCCLLAGINLSDFSRFGWLPKEIKSRMKPKQKNDEEILSPQSAHAIYQTICRKLPYMTVLARATKKRSREKVLSQKLAIRDYQAANKRKLEYLASPESLKKSSRPKHNPLAPYITPKGDKKGLHTRAEEKRLSEKQKRDQYLRDHYQQEMLFC